MTDANKVRELISRTLATTVKYGPDIAWDVRVTIDRKRNTTEEYPTITIFMCAPGRYGKDAMHEAHRMIKRRIPDASLIIIPMLGV